MAPTVSTFELGDFTLARGGVPFGLAFGRIGCLGGGCCYGKPITWPSAARVRCRVASGIAW